MDPADFQVFSGKAAQVVVVQEKVDGANIGLSIVDNKIVAQNRSHYVSASSQHQFNGLDTWISEHETELWALLSRGFTLFGEWCRVRHSILYDRLPDYFLAFDIYDTRNHQFLDPGPFYDELQNTSICCVRTICIRRFETKDELTSLLSTKSKFQDDGFVEGVYLRLFRRDDAKSRSVPTRGKVVRPDFIQVVNDSGHWSKLQTVKNTVRVEVPYDNGWAEAVSASRRPAASSASEPDRSATSAAAASVPKK